MQPIGKAPEAALPSEACVHLVSRVSDLDTLRGGRKKFHRIRLLADAFIKVELLQHAVKYCVWSLEVDGLLEIETSAPHSSHAWFRTAPFTLICYWLKKWQTDSYRVELIDSVARRISIRPVWRAQRGPIGVGIIFSGAESEIPLLATCIRAIENQTGLLEQPVIYVCGPASQRAQVQTFARVNYVEFDSEPSGRSFPIAKKKNRLISLMREDRVLILHCRIVLDEDALSRLPSFFDVVSPNVYVLNRHRERLHYLSYGVTDLYFPGRLPRDRPQTMRSASFGDYHDLAQRGAPYIDGGAFVVRRDVWQRVMLDDELWWGEFEDVDWCLRLVGSGYLVDLALCSQAQSVTKKTPGLDNLPSVVRSLVKRGYGQILRSWARIRWIVRD